MEDRPSPTPSKAELAESRRRRRRLRLALRRQGAQRSWSVRQVSPGDAEALGQLMHDSYRGTVDDEGETVEQSVEEIRAALKGKYGELLVGCSFLIEDSSKPVSAALTTLWESRPLLAFVMTHPGP